MISEAFHQTRHVVPIWLWPWVWLQLIWIRAWMDREAVAREAGITVLIAVLPSGHVRILYTSDAHDPAGGLGQLMSFSIPGGFDLPAWAPFARLHAMACSNGRAPSLREPTLSVRPPMVFDTS